MQCSCDSMGKCEIALASQFHVYILTVFKCWFRIVQILNCGSLNRRFQQREGPSWGPLWAALGTDGGPMQLVCPVSTAGAGAGGPVLVLVLVTRGDPSWQHDVQSVISQISFPTAQRFRISLTFQLSRSWLQCDKLQSFKFNLLHSRKYFPLMARLQAPGSVQCYVLDMCFSGSFP